MSDSNPISWKEIHRRMEAAHLAADEKVTITVEKQKRILRERANALAQTTDVQEATSAPIQIVEFLLAHERYGIDSTFVREVYPLKEFTPLPGTPPFILGIINLRGEIISVMDIKKFFDLPEKGITDLNKVIVLRNATMEFGILADAVLGARAIFQDELQPPPATFTGVREEYLRGITTERLIVLNAVRLLSDPKLVIQEEVE